MLRFGRTSALALTITLWGSLSSGQEQKNDEPAIPRPSTPPPTASSAPTASEPKEDADEENGGQTAGLVVIIVGAVGVVTGASLMIAGAVALDEPEAGLSQEDIAAAASGADQADAEEADDTHILTSVGAITFVGSAVLMAVGGWIRFDWSDDEGDLAITPYVTPRGAGVVATF